MSDVTGNVGYTFYPPFERGTAGRVNTVVPAAPAVSASFGDKAKSRFSTVKRSFGIAAAVMMLVGLGNDNSVVQNAIHVSVFTFAYYLLTTRLVFGGKVFLAFVAAFFTLPLINPVEALILWGLLIGYTATRRKDRGGSGRGLTVSRALRERRLAVANYNDSMKPSWGVAGGHVAGNSTFGKAGELGAEGERNTARVLNALAVKYPHLRVFHGVRFTPGVDGPDIDHVVLIGKQVLFVDSKLWSYGDYSWSADGTLLRGKQPFKGGEVHMASAMEKYKPLMPTESRIGCVIALAQLSAGRYVVDNGGAPPGLHISNLEKLTNIVDNFARKEDKLVDRRLVALFQGQMQN